MISAKRPLALLVCLTAAGWVHADQLAESLEAIRSVGTEGKGNKSAGKGWQVIASQDPSELPRILAAMDDANVLAKNWLRTAVDAVAQKAHEQNKPLPVESLGEFILDVSHDGHARRLAFELLASVDSDAADRLIPGMLNDPAVSFRRDAVAKLVKTADALVKGDNKAAATLLYRQALNAARDVEQIKKIVKQLRSLKRTVDLPTHFGFVMDWQVIGPFDNTDRKGFATVYPPETKPDGKVNLDASYQGKDGEVKWIEFRSEDDYGKIDFNKPFGELKEVVGYAYTEFISERPQSAELRLGTKNAWKVWLNGELLFARDEYHRGARIDQYILQADLVPGVNRILVKSCQNEQRERWTKEWEFQLRVCDASGTAILSADRRTNDSNSTTDSGE